MFGIIVYIYFWIWGEERGKRGGDKPTTKTKPNPNRTPRPDQRKPEQRENKKEHVK